LNHCKQASVGDMHKQALAEAIENGSYVILAPLLVEVAGAYAHMILSYEAGQPIAAGGELMLAINRLEAYLPAIPKFDTPPKAKLQSPVPHGAKGKLADAHVIGYLRDHPLDDPTSEKIADASSGMFDDRDIRRSPTWKAHRKGRAKSPISAGNASHLGESDEALEALTPAKSKPRDLLSIKKKS
jgi:hypothetical protein